MIIKILTSANFRKKAKKLLKKYRSLKSELFDLEQQLLLKPYLGKPLGDNCFKIRIAVKSKGKGKSGAARVITHIVFRIKEGSEGIKVVGLVTIYDKQEYETISDELLLSLVRQLNEEIKEFEND